MAEINIEKKKNKRPMWPWIIGLLLLGGIIWAIAEIDTGREEIAAVEEPYTEEPIVTEPQANIIEEETPEDFVAYVEERAIKDQMGVDHAVTSSALVKLSHAIRDLARDDESYSRQINELEQAANQIESNPQSLQHADRLSDAFSQASNLLQQMQQNRFPEMQSEVEEVKQAATEVKGDQPMLNQKREVKTFFEKAADAVEKMREENTSTF